MKHGVVNGGGRDRASSRPVPVGNRLAQCKARIVGKLDFQNFRGAFPASSATRGARGGGQGLDRRRQTFNYAERAGRKFPPRGSER